jgi:hypothetical protein
MPPMRMLEVLLQFQHASSQPSAAKHINLFFLICLQCKPTKANFIFQEHENLLPLSNAIFMGEAELKVIFIDSQTAAVYAINKDRLKQFYKTVQGLIVELNNTTAGTFNAYQTRWASLQEAHLKLHQLDPIRNNKSTPILDQLAHLQPDFNSAITKNRLALMKQALTELRDELGWHLYQRQGPIDFGRVPTNLSFVHFFTEGV